MAHILVVDDSSIERRIIAAVLQQHNDLTTSQVSSGQEALDTLRQTIPDLVITDLMMQDMNGLDLIKVIQKDYPGLPVILITAYGSEELVIQALRMGASSYVPKRNISTDLSTTVTEILEMSHTDRQQKAILSYQTNLDTRFSLHNDPVLIRPLIGRIQNDLIQLEICDENEMIQPAIALYEAMINAMYHGNLELDSKLRQVDDSAYESLAKERRTQDPYQDRCIFVTSKLSRTEATFIIRDEGLGFDPTDVNDPTESENIEKLSGRGLLLIRTFMDKVSHNAAGNEITMVLKKKDA